MGQLRAPPVAGRTTIATRMLVALMVAALLPLLLGGVAAMVRAESTLRRDTLQHLDSVASLQAGRVDELLTEALQRARLVSSRTQFRISLAAMLDDPGDTDSVALVRRILADARNSVPGFIHIWVTGPDGSLLAATDAISATERVAVERGPNPSLFLLANGQPAMSISGRVVLDGRSLGTVWIVSDVAPLRGAVSDRSGLGDTGETVLVGPSNEGDVYLMPLRFDPRAALRVTVSAGSALADPNPETLEGVETVDYRGEHVLMVSRPLERVDWVLATKIDTAEAFAPVQDLRRDLVAILLVVSAVTVLAAVALSRSMVRPLRDLTASARAMQQGDLTGRVEVDGADEVAELAMALNLAASAIEGSMAAKNEFLASVAHELRTPLTAVMGLAIELRDHRTTFNEAQIEEFIHLIAEQSTEAGHIIEDLLVAARANVGDLSIQLEWVSAGDEIRRALASLGPEAVAKVRVVADDARVWADPRRLRQILRNLAGNAVRYGGREVVVSVATGGSGVAIEVTDDGVGIPESHSERLFEAYFRGPDARSKPGSTGLGLYISHQLAELMGGELTYRRRDGWTVFTVSMPSPSPDVVDAESAAAAV